MIEDKITFEEKYPHEKGFAAHFDKEIAWRLLEVEADRVRAVRYRHLVNLVTYPFMGWLFYLLAQKMPIAQINWSNLTDVNEWSFLPSLLITGVFFVVVARGPARFIRYRFERTHKVHLMGSIMGFFKESNYNPYDHLRPAEIKEFMICPQFNECTGSDLMDVEGRFVSSRLLLVSRSSDDRRKKRVKFSGIGVLITLPEPVKRPLALTIDKGSMVNWLEGMTTRLQRINLVDPVFEKIFEVYGKDQIDARMILTTDVMELFLRLNFLFSNWKMDIDELEQLTRGVIANYNIEKVRDNLKPMLMANYMEDKLLLLIKTPEEMFAPVSLKTSALDLTPIRAVLYQVNLLNQLYEVLVKKGYKP